MKYFKLVCHIALLIIVTCNCYGQSSERVRIKKEDVIKKIPQSGRIFLFYLAAKNGSFGFDAKTDGTFFFDADTREFLIKQIKNKGYEPVIVKLCENNPIENVEGQLPLPSACSMEAMGYNGKRDIFIAIYEEDYSTFRTYTVEKERTVGNVTNRYGRTIYSYAEPYKEERIKENKLVNFRTAIYYFNEAAGTNELVYDFSISGPSNGENRILNKVLNNIPAREINKNVEDSELKDNDLFSEEVGGKYGFKSKKTSLFIIEPMYDNVAYEFSFGLAAVSKGGMYVDGSIPGFKNLVGSKWGYIDKSGKEIIPLQYEAAINFSEGLGAVMKNGKWGFINITGEEVIPPRFDIASPFSKGRALVYLGGKYGFIDTEGKLVIPAQFENAESFKAEIAWVRKDQKEGFIRVDGSFAIPLNFDQITNRDLTFTNFSSAKANNKWGLIDKKGTEIIPFQYDELTLFSKGFSKVKKDSKWGVINEATGKFFLECVYEDIKAFRPKRYYDESDNTLVQVQINGKWGLINSVTLNWIINPEFQEIEGRNEGMIGIKKNNKWGLLNYDGKILVQPEYDNIDGFSQGISVVSKNNQYGYIEKTGKLITGLIYSSASNFANGFAFVCQGGCGYINKAGQEITALKYTWDDGENPFYFSSDGFVAVKFKGKWGYINQKGETVVAHQYDQAWPFTNGIAAVNIGGRMGSTGGISQTLVGGKWGYIDTKGKEVLKIKYEKVGRYFSEGMGSIKVGNKWGFINAQGEIVIKPKYDDSPYFHFGSFKEGLKCVKLNGKWGFIDKIGNTVIDFKFDEAYDFNDGRASVTLNNESFNIDKKGNRADN